MANNTTPTAEALLQALADKLRSNRVIQSASVEHAFRSVPRHLFVPAAPVEDAYGDGPIVTHWDANGVAVSSASAPGVVAGMLEQLDVRPGHHVLEIGAGTGYNAALLSHLVGPSGRVTAVDIVEDVVDAAREHLAAAGVGNVSVICGDGEFGHAARAPYDRIIVTAGAWDIPPAWADQLAPGGRLVVPLRMRGLTRSIALEREGGSWRSRSIDECGFVPMHGVGGVAERNVFVGGDTGVVLRIDDGRPVDESAAEHALDHRPVVSWTGVAWPGQHYEHLDFWLSSLDGFCRVIAMNPAAGGLVLPLYPWGSMGVVDGGTIAYLTKRKVEESDAGPLFELGVCAYGPQGRETAERVADRILAWDRQRAHLGNLWIEVHPVGETAESDAALVIDKRHTRVVVRTAEYVGVPTTA
jgi:protein-L-isoaspartate(D-aspartate) O-methyltransferase